MTVLAQDPGGQTGYALWYPDDPEHVEQGVLPAGEWLAWLTARLDRGDVTDLISETIIINAQTHKKGQQVLLSVEQIGVARYLAWCHGVRFHGQTPAEGKSFGTDDKLRALDWWYVGSDHPRDATRHLLRWLAMNDAAFRDYLEAKL